MIVYLDASALVKRYVAEPGSREISRLIERAELVGTSIITRVEIAAALGKAVRLRALTDEAASSARQVFHREWPHLIRIQTTEMLVARADELAWELHLRACDATQLSSAAIWSENMEEDVTFATYDRRLWQAASGRGLTPFPDKLA